MQKDVLSINEVNLLKEIETVDKEVKAFMQQKQNHKNGINELNETMKEAKNKKITKIQLPSVGGMLKTYSGDDKKVLDLIKKNVENMENAVKGIDGQITHRVDGLNEAVVKLTSAFLSRIIDSGIELKKTSLKKFFEEA